MGRADMTIIEEAKAYERIRVGGRTVEWIAGRFGKTVDHVRWRLGLLGLREDVRELVASGAIKPNVAWHIAQLSPAGQQVVSRRYVRGDFTTEGDALAFARAVRMAEEQTSLWPDERTDEQVETARRQRAKARAMMDRLADAGKLLSEIAAMDPAQLARALSGEVGLHLTRLEDVHQAGLRARRTLRLAGALGEATSRVDDARTPGTA
jgi:ParB family transcriptional regulator, chromosome partitioning protein